MRAFGNHPRFDCAWRRIVGGFVGLAPASCFVDWIGCFTDRCQCGGQGACLAGAQDRIAAWKVVLLIIQSSLDRQQAAESSICYLSIRSRDSERSRSSDFVGYRRNIEWFYQNAQGSNQKCESKV